MGVHFTIYRDAKSFRLRKWVMEMWAGDDLLDRRIMFGGPFFAGRVFRKCKRMEKMRARAIQGFVRWENER